MQLNSSIWWRNMRFGLFVLLSSYLVYDLFIFVSACQEKSWHFLTYQFNTAQFCSLSTSASKPHAPTVRGCKNPTILSTHPFCSLSKLCYCLILKPLVSVDVSCPLQSQTLPNPGSAAGPLPNPLDSSSPSPDNCWFPAHFQLLCSLQSMSKNYFFRHKTFFLK